MKNKINGGSLSWARQTIESEIFYNKPDKWFKIWFYLVSKAKWKDDKQFKRGQCFMKYEWIAEATGANKNEIDHCIRWLKSATQIATQKATRGFIVTICNYNTYQNLVNYKSDTRSDSKSDLKAKQKRNRSDTILKKGNKDKKDKKKEEQNKEAPFSFNFTIDKWNEKLEPRIRQLSESRKDKLRVRLKERMFTDNYEKILEIIKTTPFLQGSNDRGWTADFDWLIANDTNYLKVLEGKYKNKSK